jgi:hypothetical protein
MAKRFELLPKLDVVVDLAIERDREWAIAHRLMAVRADVDDRETAAREADGPSYVAAGVVWSAMRHSISHPIEYDWINAGGVYDPRDAAHFCLPG